MAPRGMVGCVGRDHRGRSNCFNYNLSDCKGAADGASCAKDRHVCFKANGFKPHQFCKAHANEMPQKEGLGVEPRLATDLHLKDLVTIQLCAGPAGVTATFCRAGLMGCVAVDKHRNRNALASIIQVDLTLEKDQELVMSWLDHPSAVGIFWAAACGTASQCCS